MKKNAFRTFALLLMGAMTLTAFQCGKEQAPEEMILGHWANTAQSCEITIAGQEYIPEGTIEMEFTPDSVMVSDSRANCLPEWHPYSLFAEDGTQLLEIDGGCHGGLFQVVDLTNNELVLEHRTHNIDWDFHYVMRH